MSVKNEIILDFAVNVPRVFVCENLMIIDYVKRIVLYSPEKIILHNGRRYTLIEGTSMVIKELKDERMMVTGEFEQFKFFDALYQVED